MSAPTREEFERLVDTHDGDVYESNDCSYCSDPESSGIASAATKRAEESEAALLAAYDALAAERDELREIAALWNAGCGCSAEEHAKLEAERDEWKRRAEERECCRGEMADSLNAALALVRDLTDSHPCDHFDHSGNCQTHGWMQTDPPCPHGRAAKLLGGK